MFVACRAALSIYDGWPGFVEQDLPGWLANTEGIIGFWNYTVVAELQVAPEPGGLSLLGTAAFGLLSFARLRRRADAGRT